MATLPNFPSIDLTSVDAEKLTTVLRDAAYITIGFGVLAFQQAQVRRREFAAAVNERFDTTTPQMDRLIKTFEARVTDLDARFDHLEAKLDETVGKIESRLPEQAGAILGQAHDVARAARKQVRGLIRTAA